MTNKNIYTAFLQIGVVTAVLSLPHSTAIAATANDSAQADLEVSAAAADAAPPPSASAAEPAAASSNAVPRTADTIAPSASVGTTQLPVPMLPNKNGQVTSPNAAATNASAAIPPATPATLQAAPAERPNAATANASALRPSSEPTLAQQLTQGYRISGYFQAQYEAHQDSEDQLNQSGGLLNQNRFVLRRGRVRIGRDWEYAAVLVEFDGNTVKGPGFRWQKAEASLVYGRSKEEDTGPLLQFTMGMFDLPFGFELVESPKSRPFMERSTGGRALWPSEPDVGARVSGQLKFLRYAVSLTNGEPLDEKSGLGLQDPNKNKDVTVRLGAITKPWPKFTASGDITYNAGKGFHPGTTATKANTVWQDSDHNGLVTANELVGSPPTAATPSMNFARWALGADAQFSYQSCIGKSLLYGEIVVAQNLDRGLFISDPLAVGGRTTRQLSYYIAFVQEITPYGLVGFRTDFYNPNADFFDERAGQQIPTSQSIRNYSPIAGLVLPDRAKLLFQWDIQSNLLGRDVRGVPAHYPNNTMTLRLQVNL